MVTCIEAEALFRESVRGLMLDVSVCNHMVFTNGEREAEADSEVFTFTNGAWVEQVEGKFILHFEGDSRSQEGATSPEFNKGDRVEYADGKIGVVIDLVPTSPETDDPYVGQGLCAARIPESADEENDHSQA